MDKYRLLIVGAGAAGLTAAAAAWEAGERSILVVDRADRLGGILPQCLHRGFGLAAYGQELTGPEYLERVLTRFRETRAELALNTTVLSVTADRKAILSGREGLRTVSFERLLLASGCREKSLGSLAPAGTRPAGILTAGQAQEKLNLLGRDIDGKIVILGSGDLGMVVAGQLAERGKHIVALLEKEDTYGGMARNYHRFVEAYGIPLRCRTELVRINGEGRLQSVTVKNRDSGLTETLPCDTLITAIGLEPERSLCAGLDGKEWLYLCGNCSRVHDIVDSAAEEARRIGKRLGEMK